MNTIALSGEDWCLSADSVCGCVREQYRVSRNSGSLLLFANDLAVFRQLVALFIAGHAPDFTVGMVGRSRIVSTWHVNHIERHTHRNRCLKTPYAE